MTIESLSPTPPIGHVSDAVVDVARLEELYAARLRARQPVRQRDLPLLERTMRRQVARRLLTHELPTLVAELVEAAADDLQPHAAHDALSETEAAADDDLRVIEAVEHCKAVLDAVALDAMARLEADIEASELARFAALESSPKPPGRVSTETLTTLEVATATGLGQQLVQARLQLATDRTPGAADLRARLRCGSVSLQRACTIHSEIACLPDELGRSIIESTLRLKDGAPPSPTLFRQRLTRACLAADREAAARRRAARRRRGAHARINHDGMGVLTVVNDADKIVAAMERADAVARAARQLGDSRDLDSLRADVVTDALLTGGWDLSRRVEESGDAASGRSGQPAAAMTQPLTNIGRRPVAHVTIVVSVTTAVGTTDTPCEIPGYGWIDAEHARQIMLHDESTWRRLLVDATTGTALALETTAYRPTAAMRAQVEAVDGTCRGPGCTVPAARCDLDHDIPWPHGPTAVGNLTSKHRLHHSLHTHGHWRVHRDTDGSVHWRTEAGRSYVTRPRDWLEGVRGAPPAASPTGDPPGSGRSGPRPAEDPDGLHALEGDDPPPF